MSRLSAGSRRAVAVLAVAALAVVGLVAPAHGAGTGTITGKVTAAAGLNVTGGVELLRWHPANLEWSWSSFATVGADGTFTFTGIRPGDEYSLAYVPADSPSAGWAPSQLLGGVPAGNFDRAAMQIIKGTSGTQSISFPLRSGVRVAGKVNVPAGVTSPVRVDLDMEYRWMIGGLEHPDGSGRVDSVEVAADGSYEFPRVMPGESYAVIVRGASRYGPLDHEAASTGGLFFGDHPGRFQLVTGPTTIPTLTMQRTVPVSGKVIPPAGVDPTGTSVYLREVDAAGDWIELTSTHLDSDGRFSFPQGAFPGRSYTVRVANLGGGTTYPGLADHLAVALTYRAGASGLTIPDMKALVRSGPDAHPTVQIPDAMLRGTPAVGSTMSIRVGNHLGVTSSTPGATVTYRWLRDGLVIPGETGPEYKVTAVDRHHFIGARIIVRAPEHRAWYYDTEWGLVEDGSAPYATSYPVVSGAAKVGSRLSVSKGAWSVPNVTLKYQWLRNGAEVPGATSSTYALQTADRGKRMSVRITASAPGRTSGVSVTASTGKVTKGDAATAKKKPKIKGKKRVGKKLRVTKGKWSLPSVRISYQWLRDGKKIKKKAKKRTYKLTKKDRGKRISVRVTVKKPGYKNAKVVTKQTKKIKAKAKKK